MYFPYALVALLSASSMVAAGPQLQYLPIGGYYDDKKCYTSTKIVSDVTKKPFTNTVTFTKTVLVTDVKPSVTEVVKTTAVPVVVHTVTFVTTVITKSIDVTSTRTSLITDKQTVNITKIVTDQKPHVTQSVGETKVTVTKKLILTKCPKKYNDDYYRDEHGEVYY